MLRDPAFRLVKAASQEIHAVGCAQRQPVVLGADEPRALGGIDGTVLHLDGAAGRGLLGGGFARVEVVPGIVADVVGALRLIDAQEVDLAVSVLEGYAEVGAVDGLGPVGDAIGVDFAAEHADGGGVAVVGCDPDGIAARG